MEISYREVLVGNIKEDLYISASLDQSVHGHLDYITAVLQGIHRSRMVDPDEAVVIYLRINSQYAYNSMVLCSISSL